MSIQMPAGTGHAPSISSSIEVLGGASHSPRMTVPATVAGPHRSSAKGLALLACATFCVVHLAILVAAFRAAPLATVIFVATMAAFVVGLAMSSRPAAGTPAATAPPS